MAASIAGKPVSRGGQTPCITPGQDARNRKQTIRGYRVHAWRHHCRKAVFSWRPNNLYHAGQDAKNRKQTIRGYRVHVRWPSIARKAGSSRGHKPFVAAYTFISGDGACSNGHKPRNGRCRPAGIPCYSKQYQHKTFIIGDFRKALAFAVAINKKGGFKWEK